MKNPKNILDFLPASCHGLKIGNVCNLKKFNAQEATLCSVLVNLIRNAYMVGSEKITLTIDEAEVPKEATYIPKNFSGQRCIGFKINNNRTFITDTPLTELLTVAPQRGKGGFGLYFAGLAAKVLGGAVDIKSEPGDTTVSFYHPIYTETKE